VLFEKGGDGDRVSIYWKFFAVILKVTRNTNLLQGNYFITAAVPLFTYLQNAQQSS